MCYINKASLSLPINVFKQIQDGQRQLYARTCDFGPFSHIRLQIENLSSNTQVPSHNYTHTLSLAFLLIAQEILSARGQLQTRERDRIVE